MPRFRDLRVNLSVNIGKPCGVIPDLGRAINHFKRVGHLSGRSLSSNMTHSFPTQIKLKTLQNELSQNPAKAVSRLFGAVSIYRAKEINFLKTLMSIAAKSTVLDITTLRVDYENYANELPLGVLVDNIISSTPEFAQKGSQAAVKFSTAHILAHIQRNDFDENSDLNYGQHKLREDIDQYDARLVARKLRLIELAVDRWH